METNPVLGMLGAMTALGIDFVDRGHMVADGQLRRFDVEGDRRGSKNGWCVLHQAHGVAGSWRGGATCTWSAKSMAAMSRAERDLHRQQIRQATTEALRLREAEQQAAAKRAEVLWEKARPASALHPYLVRKRIKPGQARQQGPLLVLPIIDLNGKLHGLQYIDRDGSKRMLSGSNKRGHFIGVAGALPADLIVIGEGFATCATVAREFPGAAVLAAIDAGNLLPVARAVRSGYPSAHIVMVADDDRLTPGNPGLTKAREAAGAIHGKLARPVWPPGIPIEATDFNDLAVYLEERHG